MSPYRNMRDPVENKDVVFGTAFYGHQVESPEAALMDVTSGINGVRNGMRLLSLTHDATQYEGLDRVFGCSWARPRMWEQYGDNHRGAVLVFRRESLDAALHADLNRLGVHYMGEVEYTPAGLAGSDARHIIDDRIFKSETRPAAIGEFIEKHHRDLFFLKTDDWATEYEYRAVLLDPSNAYAYVSYGEALVAVVLGERFPEWQLPGADRACAAAGVELRRILWEDGRPWALTHPAASQ
jgi:Protein of unknown function (DUF2971)